MTKGKWLFLVFLILLPLACAQEFDTNTLLIGIPIIVILLFVIIFVIIIIKDKLTVKGLALPVPGNNGTIKIEAEKSLEKKDLKITKKDEKKSVKSVNYYTQLDELESKIEELSVEEAYNEFVSILRSFFSDYLGINYEFSYEELENEIKKRNEPIAFSSERISLLQYGPEKITKPTLAMMVKEFKSLVETASFELSGGIDFSDAIHQIILMIDEGRKSVKTDIVKARELYARIYSLYYTLPSEEKKNVRNSILRFYNLID